MDEFLASIIAQYPKLSMVIMAVGTFRIFFKPIMSAIEQAVAQTESKRDDEILDGVKSSRVFRAFAWFLDYTASIKLPVKK